MCMCPRRRAARRVYQYHFAPRRMSKHTSRMPVASPFYLFPHAFLDASPRCPRSRQRAVGENGDTGGNVATLTAMPNTHACWNPPPVWTCFRERACWGWCGPHRPTCSRTYASPTHTETPVPAYTTHTETPVPAYTTHTDTTCSRIHDTY